MPRVGISYRPNDALFYSGWNQTSLLLVELFTLLEYDVILVDSSNSDTKWWTDYPKRVSTANLYEIKNLDLLIDIDGLIHPDARAAAQKSIVFLRSFLQFTEMDASVYIETPYVPRSMKNVHEIWCWDLLNPERTIPSIQTLFPCPIRRVPFIWSPAVADHYSKSQPAVSTGDQNTTWRVHIAEKNKENTSSAVLPLVAVKELCQKKVLNATYLIHNMSAIKDNRFLKENVLDNIESEKLPLEMVPKEPFHSWLTDHSILFSHSRFTPLRIGLLNAIWTGLPLIHNSPILRDLHPSLRTMFYDGNEISGMCAAFSAFVGAPSSFCAALFDIRVAILTQYGVFAHRDEWKVIIDQTFAAPVYVSSPLLVFTDQLVVAFSDMWPGFNYDTNFITDALRNHLGKPVRGAAYEPSLSPHLILCGPYSESWKSISSSAPKVFFTAEHWAAPSGFDLYLTSSREEDDKHVRLPVWMTFIDWFSGSTTLPTNTEDNPIRLPVHFATTPHPTGFADRTAFCGFVVTNPICTFRNETFHAVNAYKTVDSGGALYNNIGGPLALKYPGGGCGDLSKHAFFADHRFSISFENAQVPGYITEKVLHAKMAGCVPIYWGDANTDTDFAPNSFLNLSALSDPAKVVDVIKKLEANPVMCAAIAATPILDATKKEKALALLTRICQRLISLVSQPNVAPIAVQPIAVQPIAVQPIAAIEGIEKTYVINLDTRPDRWKKLMEAEPYLEPLVKAEQPRVERVPGVNGKTLEMTPVIYNLFDKNEFQWKKSIIGCNMSHISVWSKIAVATEGNYFLVLEDDVRFQKGWMQQWKQCLSHLPTDADLLYLGGVLPPNKAALPLASEKYNEHWSFIQPNTLFSPVPIPVFHFCAYSYILTRAGAQKLMSYLFESEKKSFTVSDHLLGHPSVGLKKYFTNPLLSYCFQEDDTNYVNSEFNNLHREDTFDSDIWNNKECFTESELAPFRTLVLPSETRTEVKEQLIYFFPKEGDTTFQPYEKKWLTTILPRPFRFSPLHDQTEIGHHFWFLVQRPHLPQMIHLFQQLEANRIPFKVIHLSDEFGTDDLSFYSFSMCTAVLRNYVREEVNPMKHVLTIPLGYHQQPTQVAKGFAERDLMWSFHGTDWFDRSTQLREFVPFTPYSCHLQPHWNHPTATKEKLYLSLLGNSKFCPVLKGQNPETFRLYEALEAGCLPVTTITDKVYLAWIEEHLGLSSLYDWTNPSVVLISTAITEETRLEVGRRWNAWKDAVKAACAALFS
jgi:GR25 family glycosyltransferase involved in LPS biosynthesis